MRKQSLRQTANRFLNSDNRGCFKERKRRSYVIHKMIDDLFIVGDVPLRWQVLKPVHIQKLVEHWQKRKLNTATIIRHLSIIRKFLYEMGCPTAKEISNNSLGLKNPRKHKKKPKIYPGFWQNISTPSARLLTGLQIQFGLTLSEAMRLDSDFHIQEHSLWVTREIATNSHDRFIPIRSEVQLALLREFNSLVGDNGNLVKAIGYQPLLYSYRQELIRLKLSSIKNFRYLYARNLKQQMQSVIGNYELTWLIMEEMGLSSRTTVWNYLHVQ
ncbi:Phage integrase%2C N-terminal [Legionella pneumophila]|uniref:phage integrase N-terminal domain-containing protein n=1 Tax=Legionella pneumophila TaxID=446 RepID=UPI0007707F0C|nr:phage integrase N-terminal domain-containing protein [Legionella pneumophila]CZP77983.1 Phage integrase%2C N-terminal [Legionella pneumophila]CZQ07211.1 Phage integrase%2C N-terminal [Legionella pneumophila]HDV5821427.1 integrase [Legionella pneumophila]